jgi:O-antigen biosynthesis protein
MRHRMDLHLSNTEFSPLVRSLTLSLTDALNNGEITRAEHLAASLLRLERENIEALLQKGQQLQICTHTTIRNGTYRSKNYLATAIVSTYKSERFMKGRLEDLLNQSLGDQLEILIIDSASPENEVDIIAQFQQHADNIRYLRTNRRETIYQSWNRGISLAKGEFITNANCDDRLKHDALERLATKLMQNPKAGFAYADFKITTKENETFQANHALEVTSRPPYELNALLENCITGSQPVWRRSLHNSVGMFDICYASAADYDFFIRCSNTADGISIDEPLGLVFISPYTFSGSGHSPTLEFFDIRERYRQLLVPAVKHVMPSSCSDLSKRLYEKIFSINEQEIEKLATSSPSIAFEIGIFYEACGDLAKAWRYLQRAFYGSPERNDFQQAFERSLKNNLINIVMERSSLLTYELTVDLLHTIGIATRMLSCHAIASWCYYLTLRQSLENYHAVVNLDWNLTLMKQRGFLSKW